LSNEKPKDPKKPIGTSKDTRFSKAANKSAASSERKASQPHPKPSGGVIRKGSSGKVIKKK
jgi:hypothetical protein